MYPFHIVFLREGILKICSKLTRKHPCRSPISIKLLCNFIEIILWHGCSPVDLLHIFIKSFPKNTSGRLLLIFFFFFRLFNVILRKGLATLQAWFPPRRSHLSAWAKRFDRLIFISQSSSPEHSHQLPSFSAKFIVFYKIGFSQA